MIYNQIEMSNHMCKRYIERILNISKPVDILKYLRSHQYEINMELFKLLRSSKLLYEGNFDDPTYTKKSFFLKDNILLIFSSNCVGVTLYKAISERDLKVNDTISQIELLRDKIKKLEYEKTSINNEIIKNKNINTFLESDLLGYSGVVKTYLKLNITKQGIKINELEEQKNDIKIKLNAAHEQYVKLVRKIVFGKWIRIDQKDLITDTIED